VTLPGDRRDDLLVATAEAIARWFPAVVLYEDSDKRGRETGEMLTLVGSALRAARPGIVCRTAENPAEALRAALELAGGAPVLFVYEKLALAMDALAAVGAEPWPDERRPDTADTNRQSTIMGTGPTDAADAAQAAVASATAVVAGAAEAAEAAVADAAAVVADAAAAAITGAAAAAITDAADAALVRPRVPAPATRKPRPAPAAARNAASRDGTPPAAHSAVGGEDAPAGDASADYGR
jgi:hypothetical protein